MGAQDHLHCTATGHVSSQTIMYQQDRALKAITQNGTDDEQPRWERD